MVASIVTYYGASSTELFVVEVDDIARDLCRRMFSFVFTLLSCGFKCLLICFNSLISSLITETEAVSNCVLLLSAGVRTCDRGGDV